MLTAAERRQRRDQEEHEPRRERRPARISILREIKVDSPVHRLWAGTKLLAVAGLSITLSYFPSWGAIGLVLALLLGCTVLAHVPAGAWPRPPLWFWLAVVVAGVLTWAAGGSPHLTVGGVVLGFGSLDAFVRFVMVGVLLLLGAAVIGWTTPLGEIAPAVARLMWPLRLVKVPVDELAVAVAVCVRSLPLLVTELRTLIASRRLRPVRPHPGSSRIEHWLDETIDLLVTSLAVSMRRSGELAEAITARGGTGLIAARAKKPGWSDALALVIVVAVCVVATQFPGA